MTEEITTEIKNQMMTEQDAAAASFWSYPDEQWQAEFQAQWLALHGLPTTVVYGGLTYGVLRRHD